MFLTSRQKQILDAQGRNAERKKTAHVDLDMPRSTMHSINTNVFNGFLSALEAMDEFFPVFEGRYRKHYPEVWERMRSIRNKMQKAKS